MPTEKSTLLHNEKEKTAASPVCLTKRQNGNRRTTQFTGKKQDDTVLHSDTDFLLSTVYAKKKRSNHYQQQTEASHVNKESCTDLHRKRTNRTVTNRKLKRAMSTEHPALIYFETEWIEPFPTAN